MEAQQWATRLCDRRLVYLRSAGDSGAGSAYSRSDRKELYLCGEGSFQGFGAFTGAADSGASGYIGDNTGATNRPVAGDFPRGNAGA